MTSVICKISNMAICCDIRDIFRARQSLLVHIFRYRFSEQINRHVLALHVEAGTRNLFLAYTKKKKERKKVVAFFIDFP